MHYVFVIVLQNTFLSLFNISLPQKLRKGAVLLYWFGALVTLVAAVVINNR